MRPFNIRRLGDDTFYEAALGFPWEIGRKGSGWVVRIPRGFVFNSSVPPWLWWLVSPHYIPWLLAAAIHDKLLEDGHDPAFAAGEWYRAAKSKDPNNWLVRPAFFAVAWWTTRKRFKLKDTLPHDNQ